MNTRNRHQVRDQSTGQFGFEGNWDRLCVCGHELGVHTAAAPHECMNADRQHMPGPGFGGPPGEPCACKRFRLSRKKGLPMTVADADPPLVRLAESPAPLVGEGLETLLDRLRERQRKTKGSAATSLWVLLGDAMSAIKRLLRERDEAVARMIVHDGDRLKAVIRAETAEAERDEARQATDGAYFERNQVVAALAKCFPSGTAGTAIEGWSADWHGCVYIDLPTGQVSWHYHESQALLFADLPPYDKPWDGHDTPEKYRRVNELSRRLASRDAALEEALTEIRHLMGVYLTQNGNIFLDVKEIERAFDRLRARKA